MYQVKIGLIHIVITTMLTLGAIAILASIIYTSSILAFIGLGLIFWGAILTYVKPEEHIKKTILEAALSPSHSTLHQVIQELAYRGNATYLPPKYFKNPETTRIYIPKLKGDTTLPTPEQIQEHEHKLFAQNPQGITIAPPGLQLSKLIEKSLGTSFIKTNLKQLLQNLPRPIIEELEIAENLEMQIQEEKTDKKTNLEQITPQPKSITVQAKITNSIYANLYREVETPTQSFTSIGCPLSSAIAIALTKSSGKPVKIKQIQSSEDGNTIEATYEITEA
jgi:hypothetical protein